MYETPVSLSEVHIAFGHQRCVPVNFLKLIFGHFWLVASDLEGRNCNVKTEAVSSSI